MIKRSLFFSIFLLGFFSVWSQAPIIISDTDGDISEVALPNSCSKRVIVNVGTSLSDITLHPNGNMYGTRFSQRKLYVIDTISGDLTEIVDFGDAKPVGMTAAANGKVYVSEGDVIPSRLFEVDIINNTFITKGFLANGSAGDLTWSNGEMFNASANNKLVRVDIETPENSVVIGTFNTTSEDIFSLVTSVLACDSSITYGITEDRQYFTIDLTNANTTELCVGSGARIFGATSTDEFRASDTCQISIDLDDDNSSTATGADFTASFNCDNASANISDEDVEIESVNQVDSVIIQITSGILDGFNEYLQVGISTNINSNNNAIKIVANNDGSASLSDFETFIRTLKFRNTASPATTGIRTIEVKAYSSIGTSNVGIATITISGSVNAGTNGNITLCSIDNPINLSNALGNNPDNGGVWSPALNSGSNIFNPSEDAAGIYTYTVSNDCGSDSATVTVTLENAVDAGTDGSLSICSNDTETDLFNSLNNSPDIGGNWSPTLNSGTGTFDPTIDNGGEYTYTIMGCNTSTATVTVTVNQPVNPGSDGELTICSSDAAVDLTNSLEGNPETGGIWTPALNSGNNTFNPVVDASGLYTYTVTNTCGSVSASVTVFVQDATNVDAGLDNSISINSTDDPINLFDVLGGAPDVGGVWSPSLQSGNNTFDPAADAPGDYTYTVSNACNSDFAIVTVTVILPDNCDLKSLYIPNAFTPNNDSKNDKVFVRILEEYNRLDFRIYNRWGETVFETDDISIGWDGTFNGVLQSSDAYGYYVEVECGGEIIQRKGNITLIR